MKIKSIKKLLDEYPEIQTERLLMRHYHYSDVDDLYEIFSSKKTTKYINTYHESKKVTKRYLKNKIENAHSGKTRDWALENQDGKVVGIIRMRFDLKKKEIELAYVLNEKECRKGYAYESCLKVLYYCFQNYDVESIVAVVRTNNIPSINLLGRLRFELEYIDRKFAFLPETAYYRMTKEQFSRAVEIKRNHIIFK